MHFCHAIAIPVADIVVGIYLGLLAGLFPAFIAFAIGFKYFTNVTVPGLGVVEITADGSLVGNPVGSVDFAVIAVRASDGTVETIPGRDRLLRVGDSLFVIGRPETLRKLEAATGTRIVDDGVFEDVDETLWDGSRDDRRRGRLGPGDTDEG